MQRRSFMQLVGLGTAAAVLAPQTMFKTVQEVRSALSTSAGIGLADPDTTTYDKLETYFSDKVLPRMQDTFFEAKPAISMLFNKP